MGFKLRCGKTAGEELKRYERGRVKKVFRALQWKDRAEAVREVRKCVKQMRAILRLSQPGLTRRCYERCTRPLRQAARHLASTRDADVRFRALLSLARHKPGRQRARFPKLERMLREDSGREELLFRKDRSVKQVRKSLSRFVDEFCKTRLRKHGWSVVRKGLKRTYREGRSCYQIASERKTPEKLHEWRKRVKDLVYQTGFLLQINPRELGPERAELKRLAAYLGKDHDLFLLTDPKIVRQLEQRSRTETLHLQKQVRSQRKELTALALQSGAKLYSEKATAYCRRLEASLRSWLKSGK